MKKITDNASFGKISIILNFLILGVFVVSMAMLLRFDKVNVLLVKETPTYEIAKTKFHEFDKPKKVAEKEFEFYKNKLDTIMVEVAPTDKKLLKEHNDEITRTKERIEEKKIALAKVDSTISCQAKLFEGVEVPHNKLVADTNSSKTIFLLTACLVGLLMIIKIILFALMNYKSLQNLRITSPWMQKSTAPYWAFLGWFIPFYNFFKPYSVYAEIYSETNYILLDKKVIKEDIDKNADFNLGLWWGMLLISVIGVSFIINATFFSVGPMYFKLSHFAVAIVSIIVWVLYLLLETTLIKRSIKMNQILMENHPKFDLP